MNRTIKTIAGAAVLMSAVSLVPAFSTSAISMDEYFADPTSTIDGTTDELSFLSVGDKVLFAFAGTDEATNASVVLSEHAGLNVVVSAKKVTFTVTGYSEETTTIQKDLEVGKIVLEDGVSRDTDIKFVTNGLITAANDAVITVKNGSSLTVSGAGSSLSNAHIINEGVITLSKANSLASANVENNGGEIIVNADNTIGTLSNTTSGKITVADTKSLTIANTAFENTGNLEISGLVKINDASKVSNTGSIIVNTDGILEVSGAANLVKPVTIKATYNAIDDLKSGVVKVPNVYPDAETANAAILISAEDFESTAPEDIPYTWELSYTNANKTISADRKMASAVTTTYTYADGSTQTAISQNPTAEHGALYDYAVANYAENNPAATTNPYIPVATYVNGGKTYAFTGIWQIQKTIDGNLIYIDSVTGGETTTSTGNQPVLLDFDMTTKVTENITLYAKYELRNTATVNYLKEDGTVDSEKTENLNDIIPGTTFGEYFSDVEDFSNWIIRTDTVDAQVEADTELTDGMIIFVKYVAPAPAPEEPEVKTVDLTVTAGDNTMTFEGYELSEDVNTYGDLADLFKNDESITSLGTIETIIVLVDGEEANLEDEIVAGATVTIVITFESNDQPEPEQPEITEPSLEVSGSVDLKDAEEALETIKSSLSKAENYLTASAVESAIAAGEQVDFVVESTKIENVDAETAAAVAEKAGDRKILGYYDIEVVAKAGDREIGKLSTLDSNIALRIKLSEEDRKVAEGYERTYVVVRVHGADVTILEATLDEEGYLNFESSLFSTYAVAYTDAKKASVRPVTPNPDKKPVIEVPEGTTPNDAGFIASEKSATSASIFAGLAAIVTAAGIAIAKLFKKSER